MIDNVNIGTSLTTVLECPTSKRCVVYTVHFCNNSTESETLDIYLSASGADDHRILKDLAIPAGETFVLSTATKINNINQYKKSKDDQEIMLSAGEKISAKSSNTSIKATTNYSLINDAEYNQILISPSPTPSVTSTPGLDRTSACQCAKDHLNDAFQKSAESKSQGVYGNAGSLFYVKFSDFESPHSKNNGGKTIFKAGDCVYQVDHHTGYERYLYNKVLTVDEPVFVTGRLGLEAWTKLTLQESVSPIAEVLYLCDSKGRFGVTVPASPSPTPSVTPTASVTPTVTPSISVSSSITPSVTATPSITPSTTATPSVTPSVTPTVTPSVSVTPSISVTPSVTPSPGSSPSVTPSVTPTSSVTPTPSVTPTASTTPSVTPSVTATPSVTPSATPSVTPSVSTISPTDPSANWCKPTTAIFYNIPTFIPNGLQGNGRYNFEIGSISTLPEARNFPSTKVGSHNYTNALFNLELVGQDRVSNRSLYRITLKKWPKANGDLVEASSSSSVPAIAEAYKASNQNYLQFFLGAGSIVVNFSTNPADKCDERTTNCSDCLNKIENFYILDNKILSARRIASVDDRFQVSAGVNYGDGINRSYGGWGNTLQNGTVNTDGYQHQDQENLSFLEYTASQDSFHYIDSIDTSFNPTGYPNGEYREGSKPNYIFEELNAKPTFKIYINGILTQIISSYRSAVFNTKKETNDQDAKNYDSNNEIIGWNVGEGQKIKIVASLQGKPVFFNGATMNLNISQVNDLLGNCAGQLANQGKDFFSESFDFSSLKSMSSADQNMTHSLTVSKGGSKDTAGNALSYKVYHVAGLHYEMVMAVDVIGGGAPWSEYTFRDLFYVPNAHEYHSTVTGSHKNILDIFNPFSRNGLYKDDSIKGSIRNVIGTIVDRYEDLCVIEYELTTKTAAERSFIDVRSQHDLNTKTDWIMLTKKDCSTNTIAANVIAPEPSPSPTPSITPSPVSTESSNESLTVYNNPISISANNAGPWSGNRPGYTCRQSTYGNGNYPWSLTSPSGSFPYWTGPLFRLRCLSNATASTQTWQMDCLGWSYCQGPTYTSTATKAATDNSITFNVGAGTITINFA